MYFLRSYNGDNDSEKDDYSCDGDSHSGDDDGDGDVFGHKVQQCHNSVTWSKNSNKRYSSITVMSQCCYSVVTTVLPGPRTRTQGTVVLQS
jgi:hypothetical protein